METLYASFLRKEFEERTMCSSSPQNASARECTANFEQERDLSVIKNNDAKHYAAMENFIGSNKIEGRHPAWSGRADSMKKKIVER